MVATQSPLSEKWRRYLTQTVLKSISVSSWQGRWHSTKTFYSVLSLTAAMCLRSQMRWNRSWSAVSVENKRVVFANWVTMLFRSATQEGKACMISGLKDSTSTNVRSVAARWRRTEDVRIWIVVFVATAGVGLVAFHLITGTTKLLEKRFARLGMEFFPSSRSTFCWSYWLQL